MYADVTVELLNRSPDDADNSFDHVVEASAPRSHSNAGMRRLSIGCCAVRGPQGLRTRPRVAHELGQCPPAGAEDHDAPESVEHVHLQIWRVPHISSPVIKRWTPAG